MSGDGEQLAQRALAWAAADPDPETADEVRALVSAGDEGALHERFDHPLSFGTAGVRGALGAGPGRMNRAVVRETSAGVARWVAKSGATAKTKGVVVGRDARHRSDVFAADTAEVCAQLGVAVKALSRPLPTPIVAFAVRHLAAAAGVVITASHNPAADNGYKVYASDGAQVIPPDDDAIGSLAGPYEPLPSPAEVTRIDEEGLLSGYARAVTSVLDPDGERRLRAVYTPLHGVGGSVLPGLFVEAGFDPPLPVARQMAPDPDFPTVAFPNPEEPGALDLAVAEAQQSGADVVLANDPDADRLAVAVREGAGMRVLTGDELGVLLGAYLIERTSGADRIVATTVVSSSMLAKVAAGEGVDYAETLTGFKWIARAGAGTGRRLVFGYEEALGYAVSDAVSDKDGMSAALVAAELAATEKAAGRSLADRLGELERRFGVHLTAQLSLRLDGGDAAAASTMARLRDQLPSELAGHRIVDVVDYVEGGSGLPAADMVRLSLADGARVVVRPSGTESKLKAYVEVARPPDADPSSSRQRAQGELDRLRRAVAGLLAGGG